MKYSNELTHWGVKGMKWGVRRYQNKDGSLTNAGKNRYARDAREKGFDKRDESGMYYKTNNKGKRSDLDVNPHRYAKEDMQRAKRVADAGSGVARELSKVNDIRIKNAKEAPRPKLDLSQMTDQELRDKINRANLERQYNELYNKPEVPKGKQYVSKVLEYGGSAMAITSSAIGLALTIKELRG